MRLVDADALFKAFEKAAWYNNADRDEIAEELLLQMPTTEQPQWISCDERLPTKTGYYFVCHKGGLVAERYFYSDAPELFVPFGNEPVTHWMPLPMPPKGDE